MEPGSCPPYAWHLPVSRQQPTTALAPESRPYRVISGATDVYELRRCGTPRATHIGDDMLRITIHDDGKVRRLELAGKLKGPWVAETEKAWRASLHPGQKIEIDLRQLTSVNNAGRDLLAAIHRSGRVSFSKAFGELVAIEHRVSPDLHRVCTAGTLP
jgi:hypothetical protein